MIARVRHEWRLLGVALQYFTRLPVPSSPRFEADWLNQSVRYFPVAGLVVGVLAAVVLWAAAQLVPLPLAALLALAVSVAITGAFHEDGLADTFDALGGHVSRERALAIMRDSRIGTYGAAALAMDLLLRWQIVAALPLSLAMAMLVSGHAAARAGAAVLMTALDYVRLDVDAKAKPVAQQLRGGRLIAVLAFGAAPTLALIAMSPALALPLSCGVVAVTLVNTVCARWFRRRLGGYTGDTLGCAEQLGEVGFGMAVLAAWTWTQ